MREIKIISIDFDGTIVAEKWPEIGPEIPGALDAIRQLDAWGYGLILNTCREGGLLQAALDWLQENNALECFDAINDHHPEVIRQYGTSPRKIAADCYIDDRNFYGRPDWRFALDVFRPKDEPITESSVANTGFFSPVDPAFLLELLENQKKGANEKI